MKLQKITLALVYVSYMFLVSSQIKAMDVAPETVQIMGTDGSVAVSWKTLKLSQTYNDSFATMGIPESIKLDYPVSTIRATFDFLSNPTSQVSAEALCNIIRLLSYLDVPENIFNQCVNQLKNLPINTIIRSTDAINDLGNSLGLLEEEVTNELFSCLQFKVIEQSNFLQKSPIKNKDITTSALALTVSPNGQYLAVGQQDCTLILNTTDYTTVAIFVPGNTNPEENDVTTIQFDPTGNFVAVGYHEVFGNIRLWDIKNTKLIRTFAGHANTISSLAFSLDGTQLFSASEGSQSNCSVWNIKDGTEKKLDGQNEPITSIACTDKFLVSASESVHNSLIIRNMSENFPTKIRFQKTPIAAVTLSSDGKKLFVGTASSRTENRVSVLDTTNNFKLLQQFKIGKSSVHYIALSPNNNLMLLSSCPKTTIHCTNHALYDLTTGNKIRQFEHPTSTISRTQSSVITHDNKIIISDERVFTKNILTAYELFDKQKLSNNIYECTFAQKLMAKKLCSQQEITRHDSPALEQLPNEIRQTILQSKK